MAFCGANFHPFSLWLKYINRILLISDFQITTIYQYIQYADGRNSIGLERNIVKLASSIDIRNILLRGAVIVRKNMYFQRLITFEIL